MITITLHGDPCTIIHEANMVSLGKTPKADKVFTREWMRRQLLSEDSTLEFVNIIIKDDAIRGDVASHIVRHTKTLPRYVVQSKRPDWTGDERPGPEIPRMFIMSINPIGLIYMARQRLCSRAMKETRQWMEDVKHALMRHENGFLQELGIIMQKDCIYRGKCGKGGCR